ncbi:MAG: PEP-CTERM sorting domain-containing protein [Bryobacterales bacterium]|nr:PEP-CTERM sorting domain-containing protein [Bryobacterales bacterium]
MRLLLSVFLAASLMQAGVVFQQDFESGLGSGFSGAGAVESSQGLSAFGFGQNHLRNSGSAATVLSLTGLAPHTTITLQFDLAMWDSIDFAIFAVDIFQVRLDGNFISNGPFGNYFGPGGCDSGCIVGPAGSSQLTPGVISFSAPNYGYNPGNRDSAHRMSLTVAHTASTAAFEWIFPNSERGINESFGIDNIVISTNALDTNTVPEPSTWWMLGAGLSVLGVRRFRR